MKVFKPASLMLLATLTAFSCTKQKSQQPNVDSREKDARHDISNQPSAVNSSNSDLEQVTTNPNSGRDGGESTIDTSRGAAVVGDANMNPAAEGPAANEPTSVERNKATEPMTDQAIQQANCLDTKPGTSCPPTAQSPMRDEDTTKNLPKK